VSGLPRRSNDRRTGLFEQARGALRALGVVDADFACPICGAGFGRGALADGLLSLEHVPPRSQGGNAILLTCRSCNNFSGYSFEADADAKSRVLQQARGLLQGKGGSFGSFIMEVDGQEINVDVGREDGTTVLKVSQLHNDPASVDIVQKALAAFEKGSTFNLRTQKRFRGRRAWISDLKAAFLLCAAKFGYSYALSNNLRPVRCQILRPNEEIFPCRYLMDCDMPSSKILVSGAGDLVVLKVGENVVALPWLAPCEDVIESYSAAVERTTYTGNTLAFPTSFEAALDHYRGARRRGGEECRL
jgi:hypothetical protein